MSLSLCNLIHPPRPPPPHNSPVIFPFTQHPGLNEIPLPCGLEGPEPGRQHSPIQAGSQLACFQVRGTQPTLATTLAGQEGNRQASETPAPRTHQPSPSDILLGWGAPSYHPADLKNLVLNRDRRGTRRLPRMYPPRFDPEHPSRSPRAWASVSPAQTLKSSLSTAGSAAASAKGGTDPGDHPRPCP